MKKKIRNFVLPILWQTLFRKNIVYLEKTLIDPILK